MKYNLSRLKNSERLIFFIIAVLNALPIFLFKFFPSMDGAVHTYNAQNIIELLTNSGSRLHEYMAFNPDIVPNWGGHILLSLFSLVFPAYIAEKLMFLTYFIGLPYAFRFLITTGLKQKPYLAYLIFPLTYTFLLGLGFYNLSLALALLFINIAFWEQHKENLSIKNLILFFLLISVLYFTHMFVYVVFGLTILIFFIRELLTEMAIGEGFQLQKHLKRALFVIIGFSVTLILLVKQLFFSGEFTLKGESKSLSLDKLLDGIWHVRGSIIYSKGEEGTVNVVFFVVLVLLTLFIVVKRLRKKQLHNVKGADAFILTALVLLVLYFVIPNNLPGKGGHMSFRFIIVFFLMWVAWVASHKIPRSLMIPAVALALAVTFVTLSRRSVRINRLSNSAEEIYTISEKVEPEAVVLPLNYSKNWLHPHFSGYLGYKKSVIIMENYELSKEVFPLVWNPNMPKVLLGDRRWNQTCTYWKSNNKNKSKVDRIDYVFFWGNKTDKCRKQLENLVEKNYHRVAETQHGDLYKRNQ
ncbi:MAG: hypothetical protein K9J27_10650 [Bacteroidales bacterium]|nr:hypothetical protein [Bacteroidales bacterium]MCF8338336.1 hypothetical protein [Bacteroidales bacterium]